MFARTSPTLFIGHLLCIVIRYVKYNYEVYKGAYFPEEFESPLYNIIKADFYNFTLILLKIDYFIITHNSNINVCELNVFFNKEYNTYIKDKKLTSPESGAHVPSKKMYIYNNAINLLYRIKERTSSSFHCISNDTGLGKICTTIYDII